VKKPGPIEVLLDAETIQQRVAEMGREITRDYAGREPTILVVLKGSFVFAADLIRHIDVPVNVEFIGLRSYGSRRTTSGVVEITMDVKHPLNGHHVLIVEDIVDTGLTISYLQQNLAARMPESVRLASLLHKPSKTKVPVTLDYLGFEVPDLFVVGYGLDDQGIGRNLPYIGALQEA
jgi:hypoxanthine phosphoribosyltransferase